MSRQLRRFVPLIISLALSMLLAFLIRDFVREVIVLPFLQLAWYVSLILRSFPDSLFWILFVLVALVVAVRSLFREPPEGGRVRRTGRDQGGPVTNWARLMEHAEKGGYSKWQLSQSLTKLTWEILGRERSAGIQQIEHDIQSYALDLPPEIRAYFEAGLLPYQPISAFKRRFQKQTKTPLDLPPEQVIQYLEQQLDPLTGVEPSGIEHPEVDIIEGSGAESRE